MTVLLATAGFAPVSTAQSQPGAGSASFDGARVAIGTDATGVTNYTVGGERLLSSVRVQARSEVDNGGIINIGPSLSSVAPLSGSPVALADRTATGATLNTESGATVRVHDNEHGVMVVRSEGRSQYVQLNASEGAEVAYEGGAASVTTENGTRASVFVVGDGEVSVEGGSVVANIDGDDQLVVRSYADERETAEEQQESYIRQGAVAAEVYVTDRGNETVADVVAYDGGTTVDVTNRSEGAVELTVDRETEEGTLVLATVSPTLLDVDSLAVTVDGRLAEESPSYSALGGAVDGDTPRYVVAETGPNGTVNALMAVTHFSSRSLGLYSGPHAKAAVQSAERGQNGNSTDGSGGEHSGGQSADESETETDSPGFGIGVAVAALLAVAALATRRR
ncbi:PGF-CTERM sorting domain-containing protein [Halegenticoccus soli]|uniref:PGF-CTERM sorting domain-containing protein n=1 Tax=Halegenticoccus soli TaxID=1985678 RepID=UPI0013041FA1|nr:PGF-CTERM sorting domain-containing protein [Halegenticoccus soli]